MKKHLIQHIEAIKIDDLIEFHKTYFNVFARATNSNGVIVSLGTIEGNFAVRYGEAVIFKSISAAQAIESYKKQF